MPTLQMLADLLRVPLQGDPSLPFHTLCTDSRHLQAGDVFVALRGERFDGHAFIPQALAQGAVAVISDQPVAGSHFRVADTLAAYQSIARGWREQFPIPVVAITGSAGKTTTKEMLAAALSRYGTVLKSHANHNNDIGVAQTLLQIRPEHQFVVLEMAMRGPGEILRLARMAQPTHALITHVGTAHIGRLGSRAAIAAAKCELLQELGQGVALLNGEDPLLLATAKQVWSGETLTYGLEQGEFKGDWDPLAQTVTLKGLTLPVPLPGRHHALNWMGVLATVYRLGLDLERLQEPVHLPSDLQGRNRLLRLPGDVEIWDESYNASPEAMIAALNLLAQTPGQRRWAILGPMRELGEQAPLLYAEVGRAAAPLGLDRVLLLDPDGEMQPLLDQNPAPHCERFVDATSLLQVLRQQVQAGDRLLFKAARAVELERVLNPFLQEWRRGRLG
ncbi:UDP-N-acetylmuramoyl-tripeptide--D-alanyl-D-alanine ligase [Thermostichus vulcanus]|uniref:UDP-N-acetylmuramoyl-tripeptide--D-alanyl-D-alanine ligase n=1 Tax=Thermostichus vulcanus str. 'Rupite' TaxID=2813851 RepID=A0ABT0C672_THEVL|nr:UDP-N-acetylmuramoyl-tripeptide--D-alanyl-D-alanine ligase [Thermostichus vulcanus]MCJ2541305.1 UDP-N-acetylmuramoyl-tripeptide--D-alanyl-D-alanine ligase [Thermostichus vulcanus str. 'Rupite']